MKKGGASKLNFLKGTIRKQERGKARQPVRTLVQSTDSHRVGWREMTHKVIMWPPHTLYSPWATTTSTVVIKFGGGEFSEILKVEGGKKPQNMER